MQAQLTRTLGRPPSEDQLSEAVGKGEGSAEYVEFVRQSAPQAHRALFLGCEAYIASQARAILGRCGGVPIAGASREPGQKGMGNGGSGVVQMDDLILAGVEGLMQAAIRYDPSKGRHASSSTAGSGGLRFLTYAHSYIHKHMMASIKDSVYNQVRLSAV